MVQSRHSCLLEYSPISFNHVPSQPLQRRRPRAKWREHRNRFADQFFRQAATLVHAEQSGERELAALGILARSFAERGFVPVQIEQVIDDLKRQSKLLAIAVQ